MRHSVICVLILCLTLWSGLSLAQDSDKEKAAVAVAKEWLVLVDSRHYGQSWKQAAEYFRAAVTKAKWRVSGYFIG